MQDQHLFEYAVIRIVPRVEREEFLNAGVILFCPKQKYLKTIIHLNEQRVKAFCEETDIAALKENLQSFVRICDGGKTSGPIGQFDMASRFRWLTAMRSTVVQTSRVHPGFCKDAGEMMERLMGQLVK